MPNNSTDISEVAFEDTSGYELGFGIFYAVFLVTSLSANGMLMYLVIRRSPQSFSDYRILLGNTCVNQISVTLVSFFMHQRIVIALDSMALPARGPCHFFGPRVCFVAYNVYNMFQFNIAVSIMLSMHFRRSTIRMRLVSRNSIVRNLAIGYVFALNLLVSTQIPDPEFDLVTRNVLKTHPQYRLESYGIIGGYKSMSSMIYTINTTVIFGGSFVVPLVILWWRRDIMKTLDDSNSSFSAKTRQSSRLMVHALTLQAALPMTFYVPNVIYFLSAKIESFKLRVTLMEYGIVAVCSLPCLVDPLFTMFFIAPYRAWVRNRLVGKKAPLVSQSAPSVTVSAFRTSPRSQTQY